jgi:hypothetical protein
MRLSLLLQREPFGSILEQTLGDYWSGTTGRPVQVDWGCASSGRQAWRGNIYLNFFCVADAAPECFEVIRHEFSRARVFWRRWAQAAYVKCATNPPTRSWLSQVRFAVSREIPAAREQLLIGGNRRLRLIHPAAGKSIVIHKCGFSRLGFAREVRARQGVAAAISPRFLSLGPGANAFTEEYFVGTPSNRLSSRQASVRAQALELLVTHVHRPSLRTASLGAYGHQLAEQLAELEPTVAAAARSLAGQADRLAGRAEIGLVLSHGDFQDANILDSRAGIRVIDWENATERSQLYDLATLGSGIRQSSDWCAAWQAELQRWLASPDVAPRLEVPCGKGTSSILAHGAVWFLEEVLFRVEDASLSPFADRRQAAAAASVGLHRAGSFLQAGS